MAGAPPKGIRSGFFFDGRGGLRREPEHFRSLDDTIEMSHQPTRRGRIGARGEAGREAARPTGSNMIPLIVGDSASERPRYGEGSPDPEDRRPFPGPYGTMQKTLRSN